MTAVVAVDSQMKSRAQTHTLSEEIRVAIRVDSALVTWLCSDARVKSGGSRLTYQHNREQKIFAPENS